nr:hypothetical protein [Micromonospora sp. DSM 115978]
YYRDVREFTSADLATLNTEAAAPKFGKLSRDVDNADRQNGLIVTAGSRKKQLTVRGEALVEALPNADAVKTALAENPYRTRRATNKKTSGASANDDQ